jgi:hypothetical protein
MADNKWSRPTSPPPPLFFNDKEKDLVKQVNDEIIERVIGQTIVYYSLSLEHTNYHSLYGEAIKKSFLAPIRVYALVTFEGIKTESANYGLDKTASITVKFHKRRLTEDQDLYVREGDFVLFDEILYEITTLEEPRLLFGRPDTRFEIAAKCLRSREGLFDGQ